MIPNSLPGSTTPVTPIMYVMGEIGWPREVRSVIPAPAQHLPFRVHPLVSILDRLYLSLELLKKLCNLQEVVILQCQPCTEEPLFAYHILLDNVNMLDDDTAHQFRLDRCQIRFRVHYATDSFSTSSCSRVESHIW